MVQIANICSPDPVAPKSAAGMEDYFSKILHGEIPLDVIQSFLKNVAKRGETETDVLACVRAMLKRAAPIECGSRQVIDIGGTGGDGLGTFNISTTSALVAAACGVAVLKHGNRGISGRSGSADMIEALGIELSVMADHSAVRSCLDQVGLAYIFTPLHHRFPDVLNQARKSLGIRTVFNLAGPAAHPAALSGQVLGVSNPTHREMLGKVLAQIGRKRAWVVHGVDGSDEISITGPTDVSFIQENDIHETRITPHDFGLQPASLSDIRGGSPKDNAEICRAILSGTPGPKANAVKATVAAALMMAGHCDILPQGVEAAEDAITSGRAARLLVQLQEFSHDYRR